MYEYFEIAMDMKREPEDVQVATFMLSIGTDAVKIFNTFTDFTDEEQASLFAVKQRFHNYFTPKHNKLLERYIFNLMHQDEGESYADFINRITAQIAKCSYGAQHEGLLLRDKIIVGIRSDSVRQQFFEQDEEELTFERVAQKCRAIDEANAIKRGRGRGHRKARNSEVDRIRTNECETRQKLHTAHFVQKYWIITERDTGQVWIQPSTII